MSDKFKNLIEEIEKMSALDIVELVKALEEKFGVSASAPVMAAGAAEAQRQSKKNIVQCRIEIGGRAEDTGYQGCPRDHRSWIKRGEGYR